MADRFAATIDEFVFDANVDETGRWDGDEDYGLTPEEEPEKGYNQDQPRDEGGQWTDGGGSSGSESDAEPAASEGPGYADLDHGTSTVKTQPSGQIKLKAPKNAAEATAQLKAMNRIMEIAERDYNAGQKLPENTKERVHSTMRLAHAKQQLARAMGYARRHVPKGDDDLKALIAELIEKWGVQPADPDGEEPVLNSDEEKTFDPSQPRNPDGTWGSGGGTAADSEWKTGLSAEQNDAVSGWVTGGQSMEEIRAHERGEKQSAAGEAFMAALDAAPVAEGIVHRGIGGLDEEDLQALTTTGEEIEIEHSMSFSGKQSIADTFAHKKTYDGESFVVLTMKAGGSPLAKDISAANRYGEKEVVLRRGARIKVENAEAIELDGKSGYRVEVSLVG